MARTEINYISAKSVVEDFKFGLVPLESLQKSYHKRTTL